MSPGEPVTRVPADARFDSLQSWCRTQLNDAELALVRASEDASFRRYFRLKTAGSTLIAMDAPPPQEDVRPFLDVAARLERTGVHVPHIHAQDVARGFVLLEDLGVDTYLPLLTETTVGGLYGDALAALSRFQAEGEAGGLPVYDGPMLRREMALFTDWLLPKQLGIELDSREQTALAEVFDLLVDNALAQPQVLVHRDYHSRNLLVEPRRNPGIIDFQDAVLGPITYDLVSLLKDCYIAWPRERVQGWAMGYFDQARDKGLVAESMQADWLRWFELMGVQRHLKAAGIFARLNIRDGKPGYLADIPRTLSYIVDLHDDYPELTGLVELIKQRILPALS